MKLGLEHTELKIRFENFLEHYVNNNYASKDLLDQACSYGMLGGGKRVRPLLVALSYQACQGSTDNDLAPALAAEMIHTYSLVHDDLPICDDDDMRRGRPSMHKAFDSATALLCGDALLSDAFTLLTEALPENSNAAATSFRLAMIKELSLAIGSRGMVLGQSIDMQLSGSSVREKKLLDQMHLNKTGKLIAASCVLGALAAEATKEQVRALRSFALKLGLAFQIKDDLLDEEESTGKSKGKDKEQGKLTYLSLMSKEEAELEAAKLIEESRSCLDIFGAKKAKGLLEFSTLLLERTN